MTDSTLSELLLACVDVDGWFASRGAHAAERSEVLRPSLREVPTRDELHNAVAAVRQRRRVLVESFQLTAPGRGRMLACEFNLSISSGESQHASGGFFDIDDRPAWDTWVWALEADRADPILLAWVPEALVDRVEAGITFNPYGCIYWLRDAPREVARIPLVRAFLDRKCGL